MGLKKRGGTEITLSRREKKRNCRVKNIGEQYLIWAMMIPVNNIFRMKELHSCEKCYSTQVNFGTKV